MSVTKKYDSYFISAGEASGDLLGADLVLALRDVMPKSTSFGITGPAMKSASVEEIASIDQFSVMGIFEVVKRLPDLRMLEQNILREIELRQPQFAILIDNAGFHLRLAEQLKMRGIRVIQYVAPKVWAWGEGRIEKLKQDFELILGILPFEEQYFKENSVPFHYVGSPIKDRTDKVMVSRQNLGLETKGKFVACLPGSRYSEIERTLPIIKSICDILATKCDDVTVVVPIAPNLTMQDMLKSLRIEDVDPSSLKESIPGFALPIYQVQGLTFVEGMSLELMAAADAAIVTSGTATLECALVGTPLVVIYSMNEITYQIAMKKMKIKWASLVNLIANKELVKEYLQEFSHEQVADDVHALLFDSDKREQMLKSFEDLQDQLKGNAARNAATIIANHIESTTKKSRNR